MLGQLTTAALVLRVVSLGVGGRAAAAAPGVAPGAGHAADSATAGEAGRMVHRVGPCGAPRADRALHSTDSAARVPAFYTSAQPAGAHRRARDAADATTVTSDVPRRRGGGIPPCSVRRMALVGGAAGAVLTYFFWGALGRNTGQHIAWGTVITGGLAGAGAFVGALCPPDPERGPG